MRSTDEIQHCRFRTVVLWVCFVRVDGGDTDGRHDAAAWRGVLPHEVDGELGPVDDALVVDVCAGQVWRWRDP